MSEPAATLYSTRIMHRRLRPAPYRFVYRAFSLLLDIDRLADVAAMSPVLSVDRFNLLSFHVRDHLPAGAGDLRAWAERMLRRHGIDPRPLRIRLLCFPRMLGWVFNPLSVWFCEDAAGRPRAIICEVRNTFGERHCYLLQPPAGTAPDWPLRDSHRKDFHVSPFIGMDATYRFRVGQPGEDLSVLIREFQDDELLLVASQTGVARPLTTGQLLRQCLRVPLQPFKVIVAIHWQALKIWLRGTPFHRKPAPPTEEIS